MFFFRPFKSRSPSPSESNSNSSSRRPSTISTTSTNSYNNYSSSQNTSNNSSSCNISTKPLIPISAPINMRLISMAPNLDFDTSIDIDMDEFDGHRNSGTGFASPLAMNGVGVRRAFVTGELESFAGKMRTASVTSGRKSPDPALLDMGIMEAIEGASLEMHGRPAMDEKRDWGYGHPGGGTGGGGSGKGEDGEEEEQGEDDKEGLMEGDREGYQPMYNMPTTPPTAWCRTSVSNATNWVQRRCVAVEL